MLFQTYIKDVLLSNEGLATTFLNSLLNQLNWAFSEFIGMLQEVRPSTSQRGNRPKEKSRSASFHVSDTEPFQPAAEGVHRIPPAEDMRHLLRPGAVAAQGAGDDCKRRQGSVHRFGEGLVRPPALEAVPGSYPVEDYCLLWTRTHVSKSMSTCPFLFICLFVSH